MTQGRATHSGSGSTKVEPRSHAVPAAYPARLGVMQGNHAMEGGTVRVQKIPIYTGRGLQAPMVGVTVHKKGSQS